MSDELPDVTFSLLMDVFGSHADIPPALLRTVWLDSIDDKPSAKCVQLLHTYASAANAKKEAELTRLRAELQQVQSANLEFAEETRRLRAENEALRPDAERYRWLRDINTGPAQIWELISDDAQPPHMTLKHSDALDAAIDAARAALKETDK